jgi:predicted secreted Zn-dependent protease
MLGTAMVLAGALGPLSDTRAFAADAAEGFHVIRRDDIRTIEASTRSELSAALVALRRTLGWHGQTALSFEQRADLVSDASGCRIDGLRSKLVVTVTLPRLDRRRGRHDREVERLWQSSLEALRAHEEGHVAIGIKGAQMAHDRLSVGGPFVDCREAKRALMREELRFRYRQASDHQRYDLRTRSGERQRPWVPPP